MARWILRWLVWHTATQLCFAACPTAPIEQPNDFDWPKRSCRTKPWFNDMHGHQSVVQSGRYELVFVVQCAHLCSVNHGCVAWQVNRRDGQYADSERGTCHHFDSICDYASFGLKWCGMHTTIDPFRVSGFSTRITRASFNQRRAVWMKVYAPPTTTTTTYTTVPGETTTVATTTTTTHHSNKLCASGAFLDGISCANCLPGKWTAPQNAAVACTAHENCSIYNEYQLLNDSTTHATVCIAENDDGVCPQGKYRLNTLPRQWILEEYESADVVDSVPEDHGANVTFHVRRESTGHTLSDTYPSAVERCVRSKVFKTDEGVCEEIGALIAEAVNESMSDADYEKLWSAKHLFHVCAEQSPQCDALDTQYESVAMTSASDRTCEHCSSIAAEVADPEECPVLTRPPAQRECTFPYRFAASQSNLSNASDHPELCCRIDQSGTIAEINNSLAWVPSSLRNVSSPFWDPNVYIDTTCAPAQTQWRYNGSCNDYQREAVVDVDDPPIIEPGYAMVDGKRECTSQHNFSCTYKCSARRCRHHNATVVTGCDHAVLMYGKLIVNKTAQSDLVTTCRKCLLEEYTTASSTTIAGVTATTIAAVSPPTRSPKRRYIYVGVMGTAIIAWCFIFSKHD